MNHGLLNLNTCRIPYMRGGQYRLVWFHGPGIWSGAGSAYRYRVVPNDGTYVCVNSIVVCTIISCIVRKSILVIISSIRNARSNGNRRDC